jgi:hypothetical protein
MEQSTSRSADEATEHRRAVNQANSQFSTGPKTEPGKQVSGQNALKLGFFSPRALLPGESWEEFLSFREQLLEQLQPHGRTEEHLVEQYLSLAWRLKRLPEIEAGAFTRYGISVQGNQCGSAFAMVASVQTDNILGQLARYEATLRKHAFKYLELLWALRKSGKGRRSSQVLDAQVISTQSAGE